MIYVSFCQDQDILVKTQIDLNPRCEAVMGGEKATKAVVLGPAQISQSIKDTFTGSEIDRGSGFDWQTLVSASKTPSNSLTTGIATCAPNGGCLCVHTHPQAELYHIIQGEGMIELDGVEHFVEKGSVIYIPGNAQHGIRNLSKTQELTYLYVFAIDDFEEVQYHYLDDRKTVDQKVNQAVKSKL